MTRVSAVFFTAMIALSCLAAALPVAAQSSEPPAQGVPAGPANLYTAKQGERGEDVFSDVCASCHKAPMFAGPAFRKAWGGQPVARLLTFVREAMPGNKPGSLTDQQYADVIAYVLKLNGYVPGTTELPTDPDALGPTLLLDFK